MTCKISDTNTEKKKHLVEHEQYSSKDIAAVINTIA